MRNSISMFFQNMASRNHLTTEWRYLYLGTQEEIMAMPAEAIVDTITRTLHFLRCAASKGSPNAPIPSLSGAASSAANAGTRRQLRVPADEVF